jgi:putative membrane protein (TIGR04086 family)
MRHRKTDLPNNPSPGISFSAIYKGTLFTLVAAIPLGLIAGVVYYLTSLSESTMPWVVAGILTLSVFGGGFFTANKVGAKGLYHGLGVAILFFLIIWLISGLFIPSSISLSGFATKLVLLLTGGSLGGILGVTMSH